MEKKRTLLVIDDESAVRNIVVKMADRDFEVTTTASRDAAVQLLSDCFDVVLMDGQMPGLGAEAFLALLRARSPGSQVILMSGCFDASEAARLGIHHFLPKPFSVAELLQMLKPAMVDARK